MRTFVKNTIILIFSCLIICSGQLFLNADQLKVVYNAEDYPHITDVFRCLRIYITNPAYDYQTGKHYTYYLRVIGDEIMTFNPLYDPFDAITPGKQKYQYKYWGLSAEYFTPGTWPHYESIFTNKEPQCFTGTYIERSTDNRCESTDSHQTVFSVKIPKDKNNSLNQEIKQTAVIFRDTQPYVSDTIECTAAGQSLKKYIEPFDYYILLNGYPGDTIQVTFDAPTKVTIVSTDSDTDLPKTYIITEIPGLRAQSIELLPHVDLKMDINGNPPAGDDDDQNLEAEKPGSLIPLNDDDDDEDGYIDKDDTDGVLYTVVDDKRKIGDDDLVRCHMVLSSYLDEGKVILKRTTDKIKVWSHKQKILDVSDPDKYLILPNNNPDAEKGEDINTKVWDLKTDLNAFTNIRDNLWIEGYEVSNASADTELQLIYRPESPISGGTLEDIVDTIKMTVCKGDLAIHNGQHSYVSVPDDKEEVLGAFTVANLNDTDGDGKIDNEDDSVKATSMGWSEQDLMKIFFKKPEPSDLKGKIRINVISGNIKIWKNSTKEEEIVEDDLEVDVSNIPADGIEWWVEVVNYSNSIRDIELNLEFQGQNTTKWTVLDKVKATGIWVKQTNFRNSGNSLSNDADGFKIQFTFSLNGGKLGASHILPQTNNGMEIEFTVKPSNISNEPDIVFDISRQVETKAWRVDGSIVTELSENTSPVFYPSSFPNMEEVPNDDNNSDDEDNEPKNDHIYSIDMPGIFRSGSGHGVAFADRFVYKLNAYEFVRVIVNGGSFTGQNNTMEGSRCSDKISWLSRMDVIKDITSGMWNRNSNGDNEIEKGEHKEIGEFTLP